MADTERGEWTYAEGLRDLAQHFARRLPFAVVAWVIPLALAIAPLSHLPGHRRLSLLLAAPFAVLAGVILARGAIKASQLHGPVLMAITLGVAALVVGGGTLLVDQIRPFGGMWGPIPVLLAGVIGAGVMVHEFTWADD